MGHRVAGDRREQHTVAIVAGRQEQPRELGRSEQRSVVGGAGAQSRAGLRERQFRDARHQFMGVAQQLVHPARGHRGVPALLLAGRPDHQLAVLARHQIDLAAPDHGPHGPVQEGRVPLRHGQPQHLSLHGPHRRQDVVGDTGEPPAEAAAGEHHLGRAQPGAVGGRDTGGPVPREVQALGPEAVEDHARVLARRKERLDQPPGVDLMVAVDPQPAAHARCEHRLQASALPPGQPLRLQARLPLKSVQFAQMGAVVGVQRDGERAAAAVAEVVAGQLGELGHELRIAAGRGQVQAQQGLLAVVQFRDGGQHPGGHLGGPAARFGIDDGRGETALRGPPGRDKADDSAPDNEDV